MLAPLFFPHGCFTDATVVSPIRHLTKRALGPAASPLPHPFCLAACQPKPYAPKHHQFCPQRRWRPIFVSYRAPYATEALLHAARVIEKALLSIPGTAVLARLIGAAIFRTSAASHPTRLRVPCFLGPGGRPSPAHRAGGFDICACVPGAHTTPFSLGTLCAQLC